jgi:hypothetical protein
MTNPTSNFGWQMPTSTDLVTDLPADFEVFGQAVDTSLADLKGGTTGQVLSKASNTDMDFTWVAQDDSNAIQNAIVDAKGDLIGATAADTPARLAVGTNGQVLTADSTAATGLAWATPAAGANWSLLNAGGTALTGATTITVSGISGKDKIMVLISGASSANVGAGIRVRVNTDTTNVYYRYGCEVNFPTTYSAGSLDAISGAASAINIGTMSSNAGSVVSGAVTFTGCNSSGVKQFISSGGANTATGNNQGFFQLQGYVDLSATITSISMFSQSGNFDAGTVFVYTSA